MAKNRAFYDPYDYGCLDLGDAQVEPLTIVYDSPVVTPRIVIFKGSTKLKTLTEGDGITVSADRLSISFVLNGNDYARYAESLLNVEMQMFVVGRVEYVFQLRIVKTMIGV